MSRHLLTAGVTAAVVAFSTAAALAGGGAAATLAQGGAAGSTTFTDPTGDVHGVAADISTLVIADNPSSGALTFTLTAGGYGGISGDYTALVKVYLDVDKNPTTGSVDQGGTEYALGTGKDASGWGWWIEKWDGGKYVDLPQSATMGFARTGDVITWTLNKSDIAVTSGFSFSIWSSTWTGDTMTGEDDAPDGGTWSYDLSKPAPLPAPAPAPKPTPTPTAAVKPVIGAPLTTPAVPVAGKRFTVAFPVTRSDTGALLTAGRMICDPSVQGKVISHSELFSNGKARLSFVIPTSAKGKVLRVKVTIKSGTQSTTRIANFAVR